MLDTKTWYQSRTIWGALVAGAASLGSLLGMSIGPDEQTMLVDALLQAIGAGGAILAVIGRLSAHARIG